MIHRLHLCNSCQRAARNAGFVARTLPSGVRMSLINASAVAVPLLFGAVGSTFGLTPVFWSMGACLASGGWLAARRRGRG
jgi:hypothetical protein